MARKDHISTVALTLVTLMMLMAGILPHHHHETEVCFTDTHCRAENTHHTQNGCAGEDGHAHDMPGGETTCFILHEYLLPDVNIRSGRPEMDRSADPGSSLAILSGNGSSPAVLPALQRYCPPTDVGIQSRSGGSSYTLRGPPSPA